MAPVFWSSTSLQGQRSPSWPNILLTPVDTRTTTAATIDNLPQQPLPRPAPNPRPELLAAYIKHDTKIQQNKGWTALVRKRRQQRDFANLGGFDHPTTCLIEFYKQQGVPAKMSTAPWMT